MQNYALNRELPEGLEPLNELALDLRFTSSHTMAAIWEKLNAEAWERTRNPYMILLNAPREKLMELAGDEQLLGHLDRWFRWRKEYSEDPGWFGRTHGRADLPAVAYFSMEFGLSEGLPIHSGGLGILAGDHMKSASDLGVPVVGIGLLYQQGYFRQVLDPDGRQIEAFPYNDPLSMPVVPAEGPDGRWSRIQIGLPGRTLHIRVWEARIGKNTLYLLDTNDPLNNPWDRDITGQLYASGKEKRFLQEIVLGVGGWLTTRVMEIDVRVCHLNEGHAAFAALARAHTFRRERDTSWETALRATRAGNVFTTHTPVVAAFDRFDPGLVAAYAAPFAESVGISMDEFLALGRKNPFDPSEPFNMAYLAMNASGWINGVSRLHGEVSRKLFSNLFPGRPKAEVPVGSITNGVHVATWGSPETAALWGRFGVRGWSEKVDEVAPKLAEVSAEELWDFRAKSRHRLVEYVRRRYARQLRERPAPRHLVQRAKHVLDPNVLTLGFARRFAAYKRPSLLLTDGERLIRLLKNRDRPVQLIMAGKAHPQDEVGKSFVQELARFAAREDLMAHMVFLEDYDMVLGQTFAGGVDVWINAPRRPNEACGTSGMKMLVNGGLNLSVLDGWWDEAYDPEVGWQFGDGIDSEGERDGIEAEQLYALLEGKIVPEFYDRNERGVPERWVERVRASMMKLSPRFSSDRMVRQYVEEAYLPAAEAYRARAADGAKVAAEIEDWRTSLHQNWRGLRFVDVEVHEADGEWRFDIQAYLGDMPPDHVAIELYADADGREGPRVIPLTRDGPIPGAFNGYRYLGGAPSDRPAEHYTPRMVPCHPDAFLPLEAPEVFWR